MSDILKPLNHGLGEWAAQLETLSGLRPDRVTVNLLAQLRENKNASLQRLRELKLPYFKFFECNSNDLLHNPAKYFDQLSTELFYVSVSPVNTSQPRQRIAGINQHDVLDYIKSLLQSDVEYGATIVMETAVMHFGGNIVVGNDQDNNVYAELAAGTHSDLVGGKTPQITVQRNPFTGRFIYNCLENSDFGDFTLPVVQQGLYGALSCLPHIPSATSGTGFENRGTQYMPGYYEFALVQPPAQTNLRPIFIDYSKEASFTFSNH